MLSIFIFSSYFLFSCFEELSFLLLRDSSSEDLPFLKFSNSFPSSKISNTSLLLDSAEGSLASYSSLLTDSATSLRGVPIAGILPHLAWFHLGSFQMYSESLEKSDLLFYIILAVILLLFIFFRWVCFPHFPSGIAFHLHWTRWGLEQNHCLSLRLLLVRRWLDF